MSEGPDKSPFDPPGVTFLERVSGRIMKYVDPTFDHYSAGWILWKHPDGQWVTLRKATEQDISAIKNAQGIIV